MIYQSEIGRTILLMLVACGIVLLAVYTKLNKVFVIVIALVFVFGDNLSVSKRYLNNEGDGMVFNSYEEDKNSVLPYVPQQADYSILEREKNFIQGFSEKKSKLLSKMKDSEQYKNVENNSTLDLLADFGVLNMNSDYRVFNFGNPFNETNTSYFHKSIGGYHGAKLKRYQEMIDFYISQEMMGVNQLINKEKNKKLQAYAMLGGIAQDQAQAVFDTISISEISLPDTMPVLNMLNAKYLILNPSIKAVENKGTYGNAWFAKEIILAANSNEEMSKIKNLKSKNQAVVNTEFKGISSAMNLDSTSEIHLTKYDVNELAYKSKSNVSACAVFSEIWYPEGWNCYIDGKKTDAVRVNYILRGAVVPAGEHTVVWKFEPETYYMSESISLVSSLGLIGGCLFVFGLTLKRKEEIQ